MTGFLSLGCCITQLCTRAANGFETVLIVKVNTLKTKAAILHADKHGEGLGEYNTAELRPPFKALDAEDLCTKVLATPKV